MCRAPAAIALARVSLGLALSRVRKVKRASNCVRKSHHDANGPIPEMSAHCAAQEGYGSHADCDALRGLGDYRPWGVARYAVGRSARTMQNAINDTGIPRSRTIPNHVSRSLIIQQACRSSFSSLSMPSFQNCFAMKYVIFDLVQ